MRWVIHRLPMETVEELVPNIQVFQGERSGGTSINNSNRGADDETAEGTEREQGRIASTHYSSPDQVVGME